MEKEKGTELSFSTFIMSLSTSCLASLGELPDPVTKEKRIDLPMAKQTIRLIELLKEKTAGNLTEEEERLMDQTLYELRIKYVDMTRKLYGK